MQEVLNVKENAIGLNIKICLISIKKNLLKKQLLYLDELKKLYYDSKSDLDAKTQLIQEAKKDLIELNKYCFDIHDLIINGINKLKKLALNKSVFVTSEEYENKSSYGIRIEGLKLLKNQKRLLREIYKSKNIKLLNINKFIDENL